MSWDAISAISDTIAATAVVVSLIYLILEVRQNSKAVRSSTRSDISRGQMEINFVFAQNPELRRVSYGLLRGDELSDDERSSASHCLTAMFRTFENQYYA